MECKGILVIEDDESVRSFLRRTLRLFGFAVGEAEDGEAGLRLVFEWKPCAVILDYNLPRKNGLEVLNELKRASLEVPVLMLTGQDDPDLKEQALEAGASEFLTKPIRPTELVKRLENLTGNR